MIIPAIEEITEPDFIPYRRLWVAVVAQAMKDLAEEGPGNARERERARDEARRWFHAERDGVGSFIWVCLVLDVDPGKMRTAVLKD